MRSPGKHHPSIDICGPRSYSPFRGRSPASQTESTEASIRNRMQKRGLQVRASFSCSLSSPDCRRYLKDSISSEVKSPPLVSLSNSAPSLRFHSRIEVSNDTVLTSPLGPIEGLAKEDFTPIDIVPSLALSRGQTEVLQRVKDGNSVFFTGSAGL